MYKYRILVSSRGMYRVTKMGSKCLRVKLLLVFVFLESDWSTEGCWDEERLALLQLRHFFNNPYSLTNWVEGNENSDCCHWQGVACNDDNIGNKNSSTGRVIKLDLFSARNWDSGKWDLNVSLFSPFEELKSLDLRSNRIATCFDQNPDSWRNLEELDMSGNEMEKFVFPKDYKGLRKLNNLKLGNTRSNDGNALLRSLGSLPSLQSLDLSSNVFNGTGNSQEMLNLTSLEGLILDGSSLHISFLQSIGASSLLRSMWMRGGEINGIPQFQGYLNFPKLEYLEMPGTALDNKFLQIIKPMTSLQILILSGCGLNGTLTDHQGLCEMVNLQDLLLDRNGLEGTLPQCFANLTSLRLLDLSFNQMSGNLSVSPLRYLTSIQDIILTNNHFQIPIGLSPFYNHSNLTTFRGENNQIFTEDEPHLLVPKFQLNYLSFSGPGNGGKLPKFLYYQKDLQQVDLSHIQFQGEFPSWLIENNTRLGMLFLINNSLSGTFQLPTRSHMRLEVLVVSNNLLQGHIPSEIGAYLPSLSYLNLSRNAVNGGIPSSFGDINSLHTLDLSDNQLSGEIPEHLALGCVSLEILLLSNNNLEGRLFPGNLNFTNLLWLQLDGNNFIGEIPRSLLNCPRLKGLYLSDNYLSGKIPGWLGNLTDLVDIMLPNNRLTGPIPTEFCQYNSLQILDLSQNNISGSLPSCFNPLAIEQVHLSNNMLEGELKNGLFYNSSSLVTLDLSYNRLNGSIPDWIDRFSQLSFLIMTNNNLEGDVPVQLCRLHQLRLVDFSYNNLSGQIPACLDNTALNEDYEDASAPSPMPAVDDLTPDSGSPMGKEETLTFRTKEVSYTYQGRPLDSMFGIDLSCNKLTGEIPFQIGHLTRIRALNLSHNSLIGAIPATFKNFKQIESLDLSYNNLTGKIPPQLVELNSLAVFSVAHNNLSGKIPEWTAQFATFKENSYEGNPLLCGMPLPKSCNEMGSSPNSTPSNDDNEEEDNFIDMDIFYISFSVSYAIMVLGIVAILCVNPNWRRSWFYHGELWMTFSYYFVVDHVRKLFCRRNM